MELDIVFATIIFMGGIIFFLFTLPSFLPETEDATESQFDEVYGLVTEQMQVQNIILKADCNSEIYDDCNKYFPIRFEIPSDYNAMATSPYSVADGVFYATGKLNQPVLVYYGDANIEIDYNSASLDLNLALAGSTYRALNELIDVNISRSMITANYAVNPDTNSRISVAFGDTMNFSVDTNDSQTARLIDLNSYLEALVFSNSEEFWVILPADQNLTIDYNQHAWKTDNNTGTRLNDNWWDSNSSDTYLWYYRFPIVVNAGASARTDVNLQTDFNITSIFYSLGETGSIDTDSFRLIEYRQGTNLDANTEDSDIDPVPFTVDYNSTSSIATLTWQLTGTTAANGARDYEFYFDSNSRTKPSPSYTSLSYSAPSPTIYITKGDATDINASFSKTISTNNAVLFDPNTVIIKFKALVEKQWDLVQYAYRLPILFEAGNSARTNLSVSKDINFLSLLDGAGCGECAFDENSVKLVEVDSLESAKAIEEIASSNYSLSYNSGTGVGTLSWTVSGTTATLKQRFYCLYFNRV